MYNLLRYSKCGGADSNIRVQISKTRYVYPDFTVVCGQPIFQEGNPINLTNPIMVVKVISESSEHHDRFIKLDLYRSIATLKIYLIIEQNRPRVTLYTRHQEGWLLRDYIGLESIVPLDEINAQLKLTDLYETIDFPDIDDSDSYRL